MWKFVNKKKDNISSEDIIKIDYDNLPKHIAVIMDGNGRWAKERNLPRTLGHRAGVEALKKIVREASDIGIKYLTAYVFSTENWKRSNEEVNGIMNLLVEFLKKELDELHANNVVINTIGDISKLPNTCIEVLTTAKEKTANNKGLVLNLALNYGGRDEILFGIKNMLIEYENGTITKEDMANINSEQFSNYIYTKGMPDPDIIIRPSGEQRLSNFMLWQCAYSEFWFSNINWPDFDISDLHKAISDFQNRDRRFGGVK